MTRNCEKMREGVSQSEQRRTNERLRRTLCQVCIWWHFVLERKRQSMWHHCVWRWCLSSPPAHVLLLSTVIPELLCLTDQVAACVRSSCLQAGSPSVVHQSTVSQLLGHQPKLAVRCDWVLALLPLFYFKGEFSIYAFIEKKLGIYFGGHTFQFNNFFIFLTRHDRKTSGFFCGINLSADFMMRERRNRSLVLGLHQRRSTALGDAQLHNKPISMSNTWLELPDIKFRHIGWKGQFVTEGQTCPRETCQTEALRRCWSCVDGGAASTAKLIENMECLQSRFMVSF